MSVTFEWLCATTTTRVVNVPMGSNPAAKLWKPNLRAKRLNCKQHPQWRFDTFLNALEKRCGFSTVDDAMIVCQRDVHHWTNDDLTIANHGTFLDDVHADYATLRGGLRFDFKSDELRNPRLLPPASRPDRGPPSCRKNSCK